MDIPFSAFPISNSRAKPAEDESREKETDRQKEIEQESLREKKIHEKKPVKNPVKISKNQ